MLLNIDGARYNLEVSRTGPPLVLLHGFTGSIRSWDGHGERIRALAAVQADRDGHSTVLVDLLGHGGSDAPADPARYRMERASADIAAVLDALGHGRAAVLGYSMGGRLALHFAITRPERVAALILESASPGIADPEERRARIASDEALAAFIGQAGVEAFVDGWEKNPLFASQDRLPHYVRERLREQRLRNNPTGLANSLRGMGAGVQEPLWDRLGEIEAPVLLLAGEHDEKFRGIQRQMWDALPRVAAATVPDAGHAVHLEQPEAYDGRIAAFLGGDLPGWRSTEEIQWR